MAGEILRGPITCKPKIDTTVTQAVWEERAGTQDYMVKLDTSVTDSEYIGVTFLANNDAEVVGRLIGTTGDGSNFYVTVQLQAARARVKGSATGAWAAADYGDRLKSNANGILASDTALTSGNMKVVGGDKANPEISFITVFWS